MRHVDEFEYVIINDDLQQALANLRSVVAASGSATQTNASAIRRCSRPSFDTDRIRKMARVTVNDCMSHAQIRHETNVTASDGYYPPENRQYPLQGNHQNRYGKSAL